MFVGMHDHTFDDKGRVVLPAMYRPDFADGGYITFLGNCLGIYTDEGFREVGNRLDERIRNQQATQSDMRSLMANADRIRPDSQGRISVLGRLRTAAGLDRDVKVVGSGNRIELWQPESWNDLQPASDMSFLTTFSQGF